MFHSYTSGQAARLCGLGISTIKRWVKRGALQAYRTPGGDLRIRRDHLMDFMRAYGIPLHHRGEQAEAQRVLVYLDDRELQQEAEKALGSLQGVEARGVATDLELGLRLASAPPTHVVLQARGRGEDEQRLDAVRSAIAPRPVRIALVAPGKRVARLPGRQPDLMLLPAADTGWTQRLAAEFLNDSPLPGPVEARRAG